MFVVLLCLCLLLAACSSGTPASGPPGAEPGAAGPPGTDQSSATTTSDAPAAASAPSGDDQADASTSAEEIQEALGEPGTLSIWSYLDPEDPSVKAYIERFQQQNPDIKIKYTAFPEDNYQDKVRTALQAKSPPDIAVMEDKAWMKAGLVVDLKDQFTAWGVDPKDFNPGGMERATLEQGINGPIYGVGDFLGGNVIFYNKALFDQAGVPYPSTDRSITYADYDELCRKLAKPDPDPTKAVYGCSMTAWSFGIWRKWVFGEDGRQALGNMNSDAEVEAWTLGTNLVKDRMAPNNNLLETLPAGESDLFAQGKLAMTWSDFTEADKYTEQGINFGLAPFYVIRGSESFVETWTTPWGTFTESRNKEQALKFLQFMATDGQRIRVETSADPPLSTKVAEEMNYGQDDPVKQQYFEVLKQAKPQVFVPRSLLPEGVWDYHEMYRQVITGEVTDIKKMLDDEATKTQPLLDQAWQQWESLAPGQ
jgi:multiple sugar transport system substrate-binding protein